MQLTGTMIFYWFRRKFPQSVHVGGTDSRSLLVGRPMFCGSEQEMAGHVVVLTAEETEHFVHHAARALPVLIGGEAETALRRGGEWIVLPDQVPPGRVFNALQEIFDRFQKWEARLEQAVEEFFSFDAIVRSCDQMLEDPMALSDNQFRYVSYSRRLAFENGYEDQYVDEGSYLPLEYINQLTAMPDFKEIERYTDVFQYVCVDNMLHKNIFFREEYVGRLTLPFTRDEHKNRYYRHMLLHIAEHVERLYDAMGSFWHRRSSSTRLGAMLRDLLDGRQVEMDALIRILVNQGYRSGDRFRLIQMKSHFTSNEDKLNAALATQLEKMWPGTCCLAWRQKLIVFMNVSQYRRSTEKLFNQELAVFLRESLLLAGMSRTFTDITHIQSACLQTEIALEAGVQLTPMYWYFKYDDYAYWDLLHHGCRSFLPEQVCAPAINILAEYDRRNNTELNRTLKAYIVNQYNAVAAAGELCVARSTFLKRFARIQELTGIDLGELSQRVYLALSYELFDQYYAQIPAPN